MLIIGKRIVGPSYPPLVIAEIGINHKGDINLAKKMVDAAIEVGCECIKFQSHVIEDEMSPLAKKTIPGNSNRSIWDIMSECSFSEREEIELKKYVETRGAIFLSTPFSRAAADRLHRMDVEAYKIGSGECNNYPLIEHIASFGKPIILSTGMNNIDSIKKAIDIIEKADVAYAILHCTSIYPTPFDKIRLGAINQLKDVFPKAVVGISDHSLSPYPVIAAVAVGACVIERHFTNDKSLEGPDIEISMDPNELKQIIEASRIVWLSSFGDKAILPEEQITIDFAYATVVAIKDILQGETFTYDNLWVKRPGIGQIKAEHFKDLLGKCASHDIAKDTHIEWNDVYE